MRIMQRVVMILLIMLLFISRISVMVLRQEEKVTEQWEELQAERFLKMLCEKEQILYEDIVLYTELLNRTGRDTELRVEEFRRETDLDGRIYYYRISWEELLGHLVSGEIYQIQKDSVLAITVKRYNKIKSIEKKYFGAASGKD